MLYNFETGVGDYTRLYAWYQRAHRDLAKNHGCLNYNDWLTKCFSICFRLKNFALVDGNGFYNVTVEFLDDTQYPGYQMNIIIISERAVTQNIQTQETSIK